MKTGLLVASMLMGTVAVEAEQAKHSKGATTASSHTDATVQIHLAFSRREAELIKAHYGPRYANLPPGMKKKLARTGTLPPGWQKKMEPFPAGLERQLTVLPTGYSRGVIDGHAVIYAPGTSIVIDAAVLF